MIQAQEFVEAARNRGFEWYAGVPCSFLTPFINYVINDVQLSSSGKFICRPECLLPEGFSYDEFHDQVKAHGYVIYAGQRTLAQSIFRVSTMRAIARADMERFVGVVKEIILGRKRDKRVQVGRRCPSCLP